ncbi:MAG: hypothetical protein JW761_07910 [Prolixibacteraceae bacterium]|nr:hypothetical protein [Prolixibacteraceae bacterium]
MDDLIVIILTFIIAAAGMIGQIRKKKQSQAETEGEQPNSSDNFWEFLEDFGGEPQRQEVVASPEPPKTAEKYDEQPKYTFDAKNEGQKTVDIESDFIKDKITHPAHNDRKERISDNFSLRKAVIYSEILNRKYT